MSMNQKQPHLKIANLNEVNLISDSMILKKRTYAFTLDLFFIALINRVVMYTYINFLETFFYQLPISFQINVNSQIAKVNGLSMMVIFWGYFVFSYYMGEGRTPAKMLFGLKVHTANNLETSLSFKASVLRTAAYFICCFTGLFLIAIPFLRRDKKGLPDWISATHVMTEDQETAVHQHEDQGMKSFSNWNYSTDFPEDPISKKITENKEDVHSKNAA